MSENPLVVKADTPSDLLAVIPYLLGFHPDESIVMAVIAGKRIQFCARVDLDTATVPADAAARHLTKLARSNGADRLVFVAYSHDRELAEQYLTAMQTAAHPIDVVDVLYADGSRWWSLICNSDCCPAEGTPYSIDTNHLAAEAVHAGFVALNSRDALHRAVAGPDTATVEALRPVVETTATELLSRPVTERTTMISEAVSDYVHAAQLHTDQPVTLTDSAAIRLAILTADIHVRDHAWTMITRDDAAHHVALWESVVSRTPAPLASGPLALLGMAAWINGQGALQLCCADRLRKLDPDYSMTNLIEELNLRALPPTAWDRIRPELLAARGTD